VTSTDDASLDAGADGLPCVAIHVAPTGDDANPGTAQSPVRTIGKGIALAAAQSPRAAVFVQAGMFGERPSTAAPSPSNSKTSPRLPNWIA
jgi:hypothetical protein